MKKTNIIALIFLSLFLAIVTMPNKIVHVKAAPGEEKAFKVNSFFAEQDALQESATSGAIVTVSFDITGTDKKAKLLHKAVERRTKAHRSTGLWSREEA